MCFRSIWFIISVSDSYCMCRSSCYCTALSDPLCPPCFMLDIFWSSVWLSFTFWCCLLYMVYCKVQNFPKCLIDRPCSAMCLCKVWYNLYRLPCIPGLFCHPEVHLVLHLLAAKLCCERLEMALSASAYAQTAFEYENPVCIFMAPVRVGEPEDIWTVWKDVI